MRQVVRGELLRFSGHRRTRSGPSWSRPARHPSPNSVGGGFAETRAQTAFQPFSRYNYYNIALYAIARAQLLRRLQRGESFGTPHSRPMPAIGSRCHELRISDAGVSWRIIYRIDPDAVVIVEVFRKEGPAAPREGINACKRRLREYDNA